MLNVYTFAALPIPRCRHAGLICILMGEAGRKSKWGGKGAKGKAGKGKGKGKGKRKGKANDKGREKCSRAPKISSSDPSNNLEKPYR